MKCIQYHYFVGDESSGPKLKICMIIFINNEYGHLGWAVCSNSTSHTQIDFSKCSKSKLCDMFATNIDVHTRSMTDKHINISPCMF